jgi:hypothetical protein
MSMAVILPERRASVAQLHLTTHDSCLAPVVKVVIAHKSGGTTHALVLDVAPLGKYPVQTLSDLPQASPA